MLKNILKDTIKTGGLALLLTLNSCSNPQKSIVENYMKALMKEDIEEIKTYCTERKAKFITPLMIRMLKNRYEDYKIHSYIPYEGSKDEDNIYWIECRDGSYNRVVLTYEDSWKIVDISSPINP